MAAPFLIEDEHKCEWACLVELLAYLESQRARTQVIWMNGLERAWLQLNHAVGLMEIRNPRLNR